MEKLPKELTVELLSLVVDTHSEKIISMSNIDYELNYFDINTQNYCIEVNIDTLTRLMIEKIREWNYIFNIFTSTSLQGFGGSIGNGGYSKKLVSDTIFDMASEAFHWVAKEKGLI